MPTRRAALKTIGATIGGLSLGSLLPVHAFAQRQNTSTGLLSYGASLDSYASTTYAGDKISSHNKGMIAAMKDSGALTCRYLVEWWGIERVQGVYDWSVVDDLVATCQANGFLIDFVLCNPPAWHCIPLACNTNKNVADPNAVTGFLTALLTRYAPGTFYSIEVANEGYNNRPVCIAMFSQQALLLCQNVRTCINQYSPSTLVGAMAQLDLKIGDADTWFHNFSTSGCASYVDYLNFHYYNGTNGPQQPHVGDYSFDQLWPAIQAQNTGNLPIWLTETGWGFSAVGDATNAQYITQLLTSAYNSGCIQKVIYYNLGGIAGWSNGANHYNTLSYQAWKGFVSSH